MTRKDFELIAAAIKRAVQSEPRVVADALGDLARDLAGELVKTNPAFNQARFLRACGVEE